MIPKNNPKKLKTQSIRLNLQSFELSEYTHFSSPDEKRPHKSSNHLHVLERTV